MTLETARKVIKLFNIYPRKMFFFALVFLCCAIGFFYWRQNLILADQAIDTPDLSNSETVEISLEVSKNGQVYQGNQQVGKVSLVEGRDEFRKIILDQPGSSLDGLNVYLTLPSAVAGQSESKILAIHGVENSKTEVIDNRHLFFTASGIGPQAEISIVTKMPKGTINYPFLEDLKNSFSALGFSFWLIVAIILPLLLLVILLHIIFRELRSGIEIPKEPIAEPPMVLPPAIVGVIVKQKIGPREIAATLIDLAIRGDIVIVDRERGFTFGKNKLEPSLIGYEKILLGKIFRNSISADQKEIEGRINKYLYSKKISAFYYLIQALAIRMGYLKSNYRKVKNNYSIIGIFGFLIGLVGLLLTVFSINNGPSYSIFFWIGMILTSVVIFALADYIPSRTDVGRAEAANWLAFKKYLSDPKPVEFEEQNYDLFNRYLPLAIVLECEVAWAQRFAKHNFILPEWFVTEKRGVGLEDFCLLLFPIVSYVGRNLDTLRRPGI